jgi:Protein of unknown function (DUF2530)
MARPEQEASQARAPRLREAPPPLEGNDLVITLTGTIAWAVALIVLILLRHQLPASSHWWIWTCTAGVGFGLFGLIYVPHLKRSRARAAARRAASPELPGDQSNS